MVDRERLYFPVTVYSVSMDLKPKQRHEVVVKPLLFTLIRYCHSQELTLEILKKIIPTI